MITINRASADAALDELLAEFGENYIYQDKLEIFGYPGNGCANIVVDEDGKWRGSCIIGRMLIKHGVEPELIEKSGCETSGITMIAERMDHIFTLNDPRLLSYLRAIQGKQDQGETWGDAVAFARSQYPA